MERKRKSDQAQVSRGSAKRPKVQDSRSRGQQGKSRYGKCGKMYEGLCKVGGSGYFKCGRMGHYSRDCTATTTTPGSDLICFHCNQRGHKKAQCSSLAVSGPILAPAPATLRITDVHQGMADAPLVRSRSFQLKAEEARVASDVVTGMHLWWLSRPTK